MHIVDRVRALADRGLEGQRRCEPCAHLVRLTTNGALRGLIHRGGLRADVLSNGEVTTPGTLIETID